MFIFTLLVSCFFNALSEQENNSSNTTEKPNKPRVINPLPEEAYQYIYDTLKNDFKSADTEFIMFLQNRYKKNKEDKNLQEDDILIDTFFKNYTNNKNLSSKDLPKCAFAVGTQCLYFHQIVADITIYPNNLPLAPFEQNYNFKLYPTTPIIFLALKASLPATQKILYKQTAIRNFAKFLLIALSRR